MTGYMDTGDATLTHQHSTLKHVESKDWYDRGAIVGVATKVRKGACENCGSMTHKQKASARVCVKKVPSAHSC